MTDGSLNQSLAGHRVIEFAGIGPGPLACAMLADRGCEVVRITRLTTQPGNLSDELDGLGVRGRTTIAINLKAARGRAVAQSLVNSSDVLLEAFRPGVMERLGLGPGDFEKSNTGLIYTRLTGWGQTGPYATMAGHDINYISLSGALDAIGTPDAPLPPLNLVGDYAGGSMFAVVSILAALVQRSQTGTGAVLDIAMIDGVKSLLSPIAELVARGMWVEQRSSNLLDGGAPFYRTYRTADDRFMAVGALEPVFYAAFVSGLGLVEDELPDRFDRERWSELGDMFAGVFASFDRDHWQGVFDGTDACVTPVLRMSESDMHPQNVARHVSRDTSNNGPEEARNVLIAAGYGSTNVDTLIDDGIVGLP